MDGQIITLGLVTFGLNCINAAVGVILRKNALLGRFPKLIYSMDIVCNSEKSARQV